jgi:membrane protein implicated in regulation of membrane protease activity
VVGRIQKDCEPVDKKYLTLNFKIKNRKGVFMNWWNELTQLQKVFATFAIPATIVMILQFILQLIGLANEADTDGPDSADVDPVSDVQDGIPDDLSDTEAAADLDDGSADDGPDLEEGAAGMRLFTLRSVVAFFAVGGWMGVAAIDWNLSNFAAVVLSIIAGSLALYFVAWVVYTFLRMQQSGNIRYENAVGKEGEVYLTIPPNGRGKVNVIVQERLCEIDATTRIDRPVKTGEKVVVVDITDDGVLVVEPKNLSEKKELEEKM